MSAALQRLSMGTSQDYRVAVQEGATIVRIGTRLYDWKHPKLRSNGAVRPGLEFQSSACRAKASMSREIRPTGENALTYYGLP